MLRYLVGVDVGTTGTKSMLIREDGAILAHAYEAYPLSAAAPGWSEQDPRLWWQAVVKTVRAVARSVAPPGRVAALSLSTQGGTLVPADEEGRPLRSAIVWNDTRCASQQAAFSDALGEAYMYQVSGWQLGRGLNALQIARLREEEPELFKRTAYFLSVPDFLSWKLTGVPAIDWSNAGINQLTDIRTGLHDRDILAFAGIDQPQLSKLVYSGQPIGCLSDAAAEALGLPADVLLVAGAHDQYAACLGAGLLSPGGVMIGSGTAWVVTAIQDAPDFSKGFAQSRAAIQGLWGSLVSLSTGGVSLDWLITRVIGLEAADGKPDYATVNRRVSEREPGTNGLMFFPYFGGVSFPLPKAHWRAGFTGLDLSHDRYDMARAVMEGVACHVAWVLEHFSIAEDQEIVLSGGAGKSGPWRQMLADILDRPLRVPAHSDLPCIGAAVLAGTGSGVFASAEEALGRIAQEETRILPIADHAARYRAHQQAFRERALALASLYA